MRMHDPTTRRHKMCPLLRADWKSLLCTTPLCEQPLCHGRSAPQPHLRRKLWSVAMLYRCRITSAAPNAKMWHQPEHSSANERPLLPTEHHAGPPAYSLRRVPLAVDVATSRLLVHSIGALASVPPQAPLAHAIEQRRHRRDIAGQPRAHHRRGGAVSLLCSETVGQARFATGRNRSAAAGVAKRRRATRKPR